jgi:Grx4 family monothiol glutaredoxin
MSVISVTSAAELAALQNGSLSVVHFWAAWAPQCVQMNDVLQELALLHPGIKFAKIEAEAVPEVSEKNQIAAVPTVLLFRGTVEFDRLNGADVPALTAKVTKLAKQSITLSPGGAVAPAAAPSIPAPKEDDKELEARLKKLVTAAPVMVFIKGTPQEPQCGFSRQLVEILKEQEVEYSTFNILEDPAVRSGLKEFSNWPTFLQIYVNGDLIGGLDIVKALVESGTFKDQLPKILTKEEITAKLKTLINREPVMLFMKGSPEAPRCGFSRTITGILTECGVKYGSYDILGDEQVRASLKEYSNWPTYPQLYVNGELIGGLDIVKELKDNGELLEVLSVTKAA